MKAPTITITVEEAAILADACDALDDIAKGLRGRARPHVRRVGERLRRRIKKANGA